VTEVVLALDLGTGGCKAALVDVDAVIIKESFVGYTTAYPAPGRHEQRPDDWWDAVARSAHALLAGHQHHVVAVAVSGHSLAMVPVDTTGAALLDAVPIWSDTRGEDEATRWFATTSEVDWYTRTGNGFPPGMYTVFKAAWLRHEHPEVASGVAQVLGSKDWVNSRLTGVQLTDHSYASGSGTYDLLERRYDVDASSSLGVPEAWWPEIVASTEIVGTVTTAAAAETGIPAGVPVVCGGVDNSCMALGAGLDAEGRTYLSLGSSNWFSATSRLPVLDDQARPFVFDHVLPGLYVSALSTFGGGSSLSWLAATLGREGDVEGLLTEAAASTVGARGLACAPTLAGGTVLEGGPRVRGAFLGLDLVHSHGDLARAVVEGIGFSLADAARLMRRGETAGTADVVTAIGGGARSELVLQVLADVLQRPVSRPHAEQHGAALGAAALAWLGIGAWNDTAPLHAASQVALRVEPRSDIGYVAARTRFDVARAAARTFASLPEPGHTTEENHHAAR
jgi:xylulokinase